MPNPKMILPDKTVHKKTDKLEIGQLAYVDCSIVQPMPNQPREYFDPTELEALKQSIEMIGQQEAVKVIVKGNKHLQIRDGERRWRTCTKLGFPLLVQVVEGLSDTEEFERAITANLHKAEHTVLERARAMQRLKDGGKTYEQISVIFGCTTATVNNHLQLFRDLDPRVLNLMDPRHAGKDRMLQHTVALELTPFKGDRDDQFGIALRIVGERLTLSQARALIQREARKRNITEGRGLNLKPVDKRRTLQRSLERMGLALDAFFDLSDKEIERIFQFAPASEHERLVQLTKQRLVDLKRLFDGLNKIKSPGCKKTS